MKHFQRGFSNRSANALRIWVCNDSKHMTAIDAKAPVRRISIRTTCEIILMGLTIIAGVQPTRAQESSNIAKQAQNPIARLISVPFENDFNPQTGIKKEDSYVLQMKPVVPFKLSNDWNLVTRTIIPVIQVPHLTSRISGVTGIGDVSLSLFLSPTKASHIIWGVGPIVSIPTASENILGTKKLSIGPTAVVLRSQGHWLFGSLVQNLWSVEAGPRERPAVNQMLLQPFVNYNLAHKWYLTSSPIITANWKLDDGRWLIPVGGGVGKIVRFGKVPVNIYGQVFGNAEYPNGTSKWSARFQMQFLFPRK